MLHTISLGAVMAALWLLLSGYFEPLMLGFGLVSIVFTLWIAHRMDVVDHEGHPIHLATHALLVYWSWLIWQIAKSNWDVAKVILSPKLKINPHTFDTKATQSTEVGLSMYANSITLTPGTVTMDMRSNGVFEIHVLTNEARYGLETLDMDRRCTAMEGEDKSKTKTDPAQPDGEA